MEWISVNDRLPENGDEVWAWSVEYSGECPIVVHYIEGNWFDPDFYESNSNNDFAMINEYVSHWAIPEPPHSQVNIDYRN